MQSYTRLTLSSLRICVLCMVQFVKLGPARHAFFFCIDTCHCHQTSAKGFLERRRSLKASDPTVLTVSTNLQSSFPTLAPCLRGLPRALISTIFESHHPFRPFLFVLALLVGLSVSLPGLLFVLDGLVCVPPGLGVLVAVGAVDDRPGLPVSDVALRLRPGLVDEPRTGTKTGAGAGAGTGRREILNVPLPLDPSWLVLPVLPALSGGDCLVSVRGGEDRDCDCDVVGTLGRGLSGGAVRGGVVGFGGPREVLGRGGLVFEAEAAVVLDVLGA